MDQRLSALDACIHPKAKHSPSPCSHPTAIPHDKAPIMPSGQNRDRYHALMLSCGMGRVNLGKSCSAQQYSQVLGRNRGQSLSSICTRGYATHIDVARCRPPSLASPLSRYR